MRRALWIGLVFLAACKHPAPTAEADAATPAPPASASADAGAELALGPSGSRASVQALLMGELAAKRLPLAATEDGGPIDYRLREEIAPRHRGAAKIGKLELPEGMAERAVRDAVQARFERFLGCYRRGLLDNPNLTGTIGVRLTFGANGAVQSSKNDGSDMPDGSVVSCVIDRATSIELPKPSAGGGSLHMRIFFESE